MHRHSGHQHIGHCSMPCRHIIANMVSESAALFIHSLRLRKLRPQVTAFSLPQDQESSLAALVDMDTVQWQECRQLVLSSLHPGQLAAKQGTPKLFLRAWFKPCIKCLQISIKVSMPAKYISSNSSSSQCSKDSAAQVSCLSMLYTTTRSCVPTARLHCGNSEASQCSGLCKQQFALPHSCALVSKYFVVLTPMSFKGLP